MVLSEIEFRGGDGVRTNFYLSDTLAWFRGWWGEGQFELERDVLGSRSYFLFYSSYGSRYHIYKACVQSVLTYGTETWAIKA